MIGEILKAAEVAAIKGLEQVGKGFEFKLPDLFKTKEKVSDEALHARVEAAAHSASKFFDLPDVKLKEGDGIGVYKHNIGSLFDDVFEYSLEQFKKMGCTSFEDMTKIWAHECGHRLLQNIFPSSWANELGADFFAGVRSEMLGLPKSNLEKKLASTSASPSHPGGTLRMKAMDYGRFVVAEMKKAGIQPTWQNCIAAYKVSPFAKMSYENAAKGKVDAFINNRTYHLNHAADAQYKVNSNLKRSQEAAARGDFKTAADYSRSASRWQTTVNEAKRSAERSTKLVDDDSWRSEVVEGRKTGGSYAELKKEGWGWNDEPPHEIHHIPSNESSKLETYEGPAIVMDYKDHRQTASCGCSREAREYRACQKQLIDNGQFKEALQMDVDDLHSKFGNKYDASMSQAWSYVKFLEENNKI